MIISTDVKKKSEKVKNIFMIKNLSRLGKKQTLQSDKGHVKKKKPPPTADITFHEQ